jgi:hypothetical protein
MKPSTAVASAMLLAGAGGMALASVRSDRAGWINLFDGKSFDK